MRALVIVLIAASLGAVAGWGATRREFYYPENPLPANVVQVATAGQAKVVVEESDTHDFGTMGKNETREHVFVLRNDGDVPLTLRKGHTSCKCTLSELTEGGLEPGEKTDVLLQWTPKEVNEEFEQSAEVITNDPNRPVVKLIIRGRVRDTLKVEPDSIQLGQFSTTDSVGFEVKVYGLRKERWQMDRYQVTPEQTAEHFSIEPRDMTPQELKGLEDAENGQVLRIQVKPGLKLGSIHQTFHIHHNYEERGPLEISVFGKVVGDITVFGAEYKDDLEYVDLGNVPSSQGRKTRLFLVVKGQYRDDVEISLKDVDPAAALKVEVGKPTTSGGKSLLWPVTIEIPPGTDPVSRLGSELGRLARIEFKTTHPDIPSFFVKLRFAVTEK